MALAFQLLTYPAVERAEHRSATRGAEAHVFERSELCAAPPAREERRGPMRRSRIGSRPGCAFFWLLFFAQAKKSDSLLRSRSESLCFQALASASFSKEKKFQMQEQELSLSFGERVTSLCLCKEKVPKRRAFPTAEWLVKHTLPPRPTRCARRVHSANGIFRHKILVVSKNDVHPCTSPFGSCPSAPSLRKRARQVKSQSKITGNRNRTAFHSGSMA